MEEVGNEDLAVTNPGRYAGMGIMISGTVRSRHAGFEIGRLSRRSDNGLPGLDSRRCFVYELLLTREKFYEEADYVWRRTGTGPQSSGHGCVRDSTPPLMCRGPSRRWVYCWGMAAAGGAGDMRRRSLQHVSGFSWVPTSFPPGHNLSSPLNTTVLSLSLAFLNPVSLPLRIPVSLPQYPAAAVPAAFSLRYHSADVGLGARHERRHGFAIAAVVLVGMQPYSLLLPSGF